MAADASQSLKVHQAVARALVDNGVTTRFGLMGEGNLYLTDSFIRECGGEYVSASHEAGAVLMGLGAAGVYYVGSALLESLRDEERTLAMRALVQQREQEAQERETEQQCVWETRDWRTGRWCRPCLTHLSLSPAQAPRPL